MARTLVLDVSGIATQGPTFDYGAAAALGARAVLCRASQGQGSPDRLYATHIRRAAEAGLMVGSYHVLEAHWPGVEEQVRQYHSIAAASLCPVVDVEPTAASAAVPLEQVAERAADFAEASGAAWGRPGLLYTYLDYLARMRASERGLAALERVRAAGWGLWLAAYRAAEPGAGEGAPWGEWRGWQFGQVVVGGDEVDVSWFVGDESELASLGAGAA